MNKVKNYALFICDMQVNTINKLFYKDNVINNINKLSYMKKYIPSIKLGILGEFIPEKLGLTDSSIDRSNIDMYGTKIKYSMVDNYLIHQLNKHNISDIILTGMETQWCINNTTKDLIDLNYKVHIPQDAIGNSLSNNENIYNIKYLENINNNVNITTTDAFICNFLDKNDDLALQKYLKLIKK